MILIEKTLVTNDNIESLKDQASARDQAAEIAVGQTIKLFRSIMNGFSVDTMVFYGTSRAAQAQGGDSVWGDWDPETSTLTDDDGNIYDLDGSLVDSEPAE